ncbi:hypothetical protein THAOC_11011 [Thalassiosira oceanica]|uniref:Uncharacterized protein n=1 Tax=Thalassiosira oceanica TaxID=159749 RepID=K0TBM5_THAOC|nr:hypothetical protein THAOC_11011 [Thalassiosira oceanica]|eukprot:EJK67887.1 hypothetical protein THAOC_11011 [Thalassiosira oceanica]
MEVAEECIPDQNRPPISILASVKAVDPAMTDDFGLEVKCRSTPRKYTARRTPPVTERQRSAHGDITGFDIRRFSTSDLHAADSQVNSKYVQMDVGTLTDGLSPNIHRSTAIASIIRFACFRLLRFIRFSIAWYHKHYCAKAYTTLHYRGTYLLQRESTLSGGRTTSSDHDSRAGPEVRDDDDDDDDGGYSFDARRDQKATGPTRDSNLGPTEIVFAIMIMWTGGGSDPASRRPGPTRDSNSGPPAPEAGIIPLDTLDTLDTHSCIVYNKTLRRL